jgi:pyrroline-5-carboxylate reductase
MGTSIIEGACRKGILKGTAIAIYDKFPAKARSFAKAIRGKAAHSLEALIRGSDILLLAIKPQDFPDFAVEAKKFLEKKQGVISILAGFTVEKIRQGLGPVSVVRAMPNLGAKVGGAMTAITGQDKMLLGAAAEIFEGCGEVVTLPENAFDDVTAMSGSGPAYFFYLMELLTDFGVKRGIPAKVAARLAIQTGLGAALLAKNSADSCAELRQKVTSKKGTTEAALKMLMKKRFGKIFQSALAAAARRSRQLRAK